MSARSLSVLCILLAVRPAPAEDAPAGPLKLSADPPVVAVSATAPGRRFIDLPSLEYRFNVETACGGDRAPRSLSINVADTHLALPGAALEGEPGRELVLTVPGRQLAPIAVDDFCVIETRINDDETLEAAPESALEIVPATAAAGSKRLLTVPAVISAQASLVCGGGDGDEGGQRISYVTEPLGVTLACAAPPGPAAGPP